jgi:hypothetical protein
MSIDALNAGGRDHPQSGQPFDDVAWQRGSFPHHHDRVVRGQALDQFVFVGDVIVEDGDLGSGRHG